MMEYFYRIYGLRVQSQIPFSEAVPETAGEAEVKIVFGRMPDSCWKRDRRATGPGQTALYRPGSASGTEHRSMWKGAVGSPWSFRRNRNCL